VATLIRVRPPPYGLIPKIGTQHPLDTRPALFARSGHAGICSNTVQHMIDAPSAPTVGPAGKRMAAGVLFCDPARRVLLVEPTYKPQWEIPGGSVEADESPYVAAVRELQEELGLSVPVGRLLVVDWVPPGPLRTEGIMLVYDGGALGPAQTEQIRLPQQELRSWAWCTIAEIRQRASDLLARRIIAAVHAQADATTRYLEAGHPVA